MRYHLAALLLNTLMIQSYASSAFQFPTVSLNPDGTFKRHAIPTSRSPVRKVVDSAERLTYEVDIGEWKVTAVKFHSKQTAFGTDEGKNFATVCESKDGVNVGDLMRQGKDAEPIFNELEQMFKEDSAKIAQTDQKNK